MKRLKFLCICMALLMVMSACKAKPSDDKTTEGTKKENPSATNEKTTEAESETQMVEEGIYKASDEYVKTIGRTYFDDNDIRWCAFSGSGIEFKVKGTKADITIIGDKVAIGGTAGNKARFAIYVDGEKVVDEMLKKALQSYTVFESDEEKEVTIKILKLSETANSTMGIKEIKVDGTAPTPTEEKELLIEFIGDSITCGYGVDDEVKENHFKTDTEDVTKAYAYKTAMAMDADYSMVSISGYGIISGYSGDGNIVSAQTIPQYYDKVGFSYGDFLGTEVASIEWDFEKRQPDMIVINLGTNDDSYCKNDKEKQAAYADEYKTFLAKIRSLNPDAKIYCTLGIMGGRLYPTIEAAVKEYMEESKDTNVACMKFDEQQAADGYAADWHPTEKTHEKASKKLVDFLKNGSEVEGGKTTERPVVEYDPNKPVIALTFDDGPNTTTTVQVLDLLEKYNIVASFFLIGNNITPGTEAVVKRAYDMGCEINNHSKTHSMMNKMEAEEIVAEIKFTSDKIKAITGEEPKFFRPPYIAVNKTMYDNVGLPFICGFGANDWEDKVSAEERSEKMIKQAKDGGITLLHDTQGNSKTVEALDTIIPTLLEQGFQFVTVSQVFEAQGVEPKTTEMYTYVGK